MALKSYFTPESLAEALALKAEYGRDLWVMAGGTIFMHLINDGYIFPELVMGLRRAGMDRVSANGVTVIGAGATITRMTGLNSHPMLQDAAQSVAGWAVRNMGTVGGNLFARAPYGDFGVALLALDAELHIQSNHSARTISLAEFYAVGRQLAEDELVCEIRVPNETGRTFFHKFSRRQANAATIVAVAVNLTIEAGRVTSAAIALGGADQTPVRSEVAESILVGAEMSAAGIEAAATAAAAASNPITDAVASEWYRRKMVRVQLSRALTALMEGEN